MGGNDLVSVEVIVIVEKDTSVEVEQGGKRLYLPLSKLGDDSDGLTEGAPATLYIPRWLADDRELEYGD